MAKRERSLFGLGMLVAAGSLFFLIRRLLGEGERDPSPSRSGPVTSPVPPERPAAAPMQRAAKPLPAPAAEDLPDDDLTEINGIGATYARRLHQAGIRTFADLAALTAEEARKLAKAQPWQADPADWIAQAEARLERNNPNL